MTDENNNEATVEDVADEPTPAPKKAVRKPKTVKVIAKVRIGTENGTCQIGDEIKMKAEDARILQKAGKIEVVI